VADDVVANRVLALGMGYGALWVIDMKKSTSKPNSATTTETTKLECAAGYSNA